MIEPDLIVRALLVLVIAGVVMGLVAYVCGLVRDGGSWRP